MFILVPADLNLQLFSCLFVFWGFFLFVCLVIFLVFFVLFFFFFFGGGGGGGGSTICSIILKEKVAMYRMCLLG